MQNKRILLVEPNFPIQPKSKNHHNFLPIGLLKIASYLRNKGHKIKLIRGNPNDPKKISEIMEFNPDEIWVTSLFTYWAKYVRETVQYYKHMFPKAKIIVGGIYATLMPKHCKKYTGCDEVFQGIHPEAENHPPAYDLVKNANPHPIDYQIIHASRGCIRKCPFCGTWKLEPEFKPKKSIKKEVKFKKIIFYDNNFLANPYVENILNELKELRKLGKIEWCEAQSGFDGRILLEKPYLAKMIKEAGFRYPRIAWDWEYSQYPQIEKQINLLKDAGYRSYDIYVFMLYNWDIPFEEMEKKRIKCWEWKVQIADCRYRPLDQSFDNYNPRVLGQTNKDYHIHKGWTDLLVKQFRRNVRRQNICVRQKVPFYSKQLERKKLGKKRIREIIQTARKIKEKNKLIKYLEDINIDYWFPDEITFPEQNKLK